MLFGLYLSFTDYDLLNPPLWVGLDNFANLSRDRLFRQALANTLMFVAGRDGAGVGAVAAGRAAVRPGVPRARHPEGDVLPAGAAAGGGGGRDLACAAASERRHDMARRRPVGH